jgi:hypothetical protein
MLLALLTNIRLSWKGLPLTNTLAYFAHSQLTKKISIEQTAPGFKLLPDRPSRTLQLLSQRYQGL